MAPARSSVRLGRSLQSANDCLRCVPTPNNALDPDSRAGKAHELRGHLCNTNVNLTPNPGILQGERATIPSAIEWTDETWNPVTGCTRVSPGCDNCYMFALYPRLRAMGVIGYATSPDDVRLLPQRLSVPLKWKKPRHVFVNSMADLFHQRVPFDFVSETFDVMRKAASERGHVFQVLTKRPGRAVAWWNEYEKCFPEGWPPNIWIGTSVESQKDADNGSRSRRIGSLLGGRSA